MLKTRSRLILENNHEHKTKQTVIIFFVKMTLQEMPSIKMNFRLINLFEDRLNSYVKGYHEYKDMWKPNTGDEVRAEREPSKPVK